MGFWLIGSALGREATQCRVKHAWTLTLGNPDCKTRFCWRDTGQWAKPCKSVPLSEKFRVPAPTYLPTSWIWGWNTRMHGKHPTQCLPQRVSHEDDDDGGDADDDDADPWTCHRYNVATWTIMAPTVPRAPGEAENILGLEKTSMGQVEDAHKTTVSR